MCVAVHVCMCCACHMYVYVSLYLVVSVIDLSLSHCCGFSVVLAHDIYFVSLLCSPLYSLPFNPAS
jgi:hypothetical protein